MTNFTIIGLAQHFLEARKLRLSDVVLRGVLVFTLLFVQAVALNHTHSADLADRVDCDICLKVSSSDDVLLSTNLLLEVKTVPSVYASKTLDPLHSVTFRATARGPPLA
jgi:hypothetical protein